MQELEQMIIRVGVFFSGRQFVVVFVTRDGETLQFSMLATARITLPQDMMSITRQYVQRYADDYSLQYTAMR